MISKPKGVKAKIKKPKKPKNPKKPSRTPEQRRLDLKKAQHIKDIKEVYLTSGFNHLSDLSNVEFTFKGRACDFDDVFLMENVLVLVEHTSHNEANVSDHLLKKKIIFDYINSDQSGFIEYIKNNFPVFSIAANPLYQNHHYQIRIVYSSLNMLKQSTKEHVRDVYFLDYPYLRYFRTLVRTVKLSSKYEMLDFLDVKAGKFSTNALSSSSSTSSKFEGSVLPESQSHFPKEFKVVSFYISARELIQRAYVLRRDSWREQSNIYQRLIDKKKIEGIRRHLLDKKGVFINNIIVTLPTETKILDLSNNQINTSAIVEVQSAKIELPVSYNSVGVIDGQHRAFSYYEGGQNEAEIAVLREQQNLLVTGIVFPQNADEITRDRFSASLFLQINANQTKVKPALIQEIGVILKPFAVQSIARRVLRGLNERGPFSAEFETAFSEGAKIKTASVVNYALMPLIRPGAAESLYSTWDSPTKEKLLQDASGGTADESVIYEYVEYCVRQINTFIGALKTNFDNNRWTANSAVENRVLTTVIVNGMLHCLRRLSGAGKILDADTYRLALADVNNFNFTSYKSSHYNQLGQDLAFEYFAIPRTELPIVVSGD